MFNCYDFGQLNNQVDQCGNRNTSPNQFDQCGNRNTSSRRERCNRYPNLEYARLVNLSPEQTNIPNGGSLVFTDILLNCGGIVTFTPNTGNIKLEEGGVYFVIYESEVYSTEATTANHTLGLILELDNDPVLGSGTTVVVGAMQRAELVSHAIIVAQRGNPNLLRLINQSGRNVNAFGANISIIKIAELRR
ncbi:hypothetical protein [Clostridium saccharobutylicum]|uniref:BclA C-terminal domain-containing protein n=1 Tax=Clostridium saccharobutylicum DSM 13864 TaxID=1345695 RepID=U5MT63_CLOSA|nr:hypothetical protein [Clostridium saccharobutylicum]AGX43723.1 hypothetical protein CLSA_c27530 [Clostridium saccharobutylicum DSM 13864]AQR91021.1 hypothetical protein CLOSC_27430 [Clostridium saccharobutylicum]AQS00925.1 hypothetical protein CSACC_27500 [Clostridium saccharobutylicum]AQS10663.1 hypothetical protein CLOBY_28090 [Clostridium saccharobutylicum]AQS14908.1 hypothetical protein CLOSACC_27500 [Clostridium saccharobutylicum]